MRLPSSAFHFDVNISSIATSTHCGNFGIAFRKVSSIVLFGNLGNCGTVDIGDTEGGSASKFHFLAGMLRGRADERQDDGQQDKAVGHAEDNDTEPQSEEDDEDVGFGAGKHDDGKEGGESSMDDRGAHLREGDTSLVHTLFSSIEALGSLHDEVGVGDMG